MYYGSSEHIGRGQRQKFLAQPKVLKSGEYFVYFLILELNRWDERFAVQPQMIRSEIPHSHVAQISGQ